MRIEVIIPAGRPAVQRALRSLALQSEPPERVTLVGNEPELLALDPCGLPVRVLRHSSQRYCYGLNDIALRRNVGAWWAREPWVLCFDDDQVAPRGMLAALRARLREGPLVYGHYRYIDIEDHGLEALLDLPPEAGRTREHPPNAWHLYYSGYSGLLGCDAELLRSVGWDMVLNGTRPAHEDQHLAYRLTRALGDEGRLFVHEPPFAWHPNRREPPFAPGPTNACSRAVDGHQWEERSRFGVSWLSCARCPYMRVQSQGDPGRPMLIMPFDPRAVRVEEVAL